MRLRNGVRGRERTSEDSASRVRRYTKILLFVIRAQVHGRLTRSVAHSYPYLLLVPPPPTSFCTGSHPIPVWRVVRRSFPVHTRTHHVLFILFLLVRSTLSILVSTAASRGGVPARTTIGREPRPPRYVRRALARYTGHTSLSRPARGRAVRTTTDKSVSLYYYYPPYHTPYSAA